MIQFTKSTKINIKGEVMLRTAIILLILTPSLSLASSLSENIHNKIKLKFYHKPSTAIQNIPTKELTPIQGYVFLKTTKLDSNETLYRITTAYGK